jgi:hypothetical protein
MTTACQPDAVGTALGQKISAGIPDLWAVEAPPDRAITVMVSGSTMLAMFATHGLHCFGNIFDGRGQHGTFRIRDIAA